MAILLSRLPSRQRMSAVALILIEAVMLAWLMEAHAFAVCAALVALAGLTAPENGLLRSFPQTIANVMILAFFGVRYVIASTDIDPDRQFINSSLALEVASACVVVQLSVLFQSAYADRLPVWFLSASAVGYVFSGDVRLPIMLREEFLGLNSAYFVCWGIYGSACRLRRSEFPRRDWTRLVVLGAIFAVATASMVGLSRAFQWYEHAFERWLSDQLLDGQQTPGGIGFSGTGGLSEISNFRNLHPELPALMIFGDAEPGYLRGKVFHYFDGREWNDIAERRMIGPVSVPITPGRLPRSPSTMFQIVDTPPGRIRWLDVWPQSEQFSWYVFAPLEASALVADGTAMMLSDDRIVSWGARDALAPYTVLVGEIAPPEAFPADYLRGLPDDLDPRVISLANSIFRGTATFAEKRRAVEDFFRKGFVYRLGGGRPPRSANRLVNFLINDRAGHCEYFATATTLLLRLGGVPARYVTGFVADERNPFDGSWIARNKDAHAWVEAYDAESQTWVTIETTPAEGRPIPSSASWQRQAQEAIGAFCKRLLTYFKLGLFREVLATLAAPVLWLGLVGVIIWFVGRFRRRSRLAAHRAEGNSLPTAVQELSVEREFIDKHLRSAGIVRRDEETILGFAERIQEQHPPERFRKIADWYRRYAALRFGDRPVAPVELEAVRRDRQSIEIGSEDGTI